MPGVFLDHACVGVAKVNLILEQSGLWSRDGRNGKPAVKIAVPRLAVCSWHEGTRAARGAVAGNRRVMVRTDRIVRMQPQLVMAGSMSRAPWS
jgi:hypothetical protein